MTTHQPSREEALTAAARCLAEARRVRDSLSVEEAARRAHRAGGPSIPELERRIRARRDTAAPSRAA